MIYRAIGVMSGSSLDGLDIVFVEFHENAGKWNFEIKNAVCMPYMEEWVTLLKNAPTLNAVDYLLLDTDYGHYIGHHINEFVKANDLQYKVAVIGVHGHTSFHIPERKMTAQLGDGAAIAAETGIPVVSDLRAMDVALGGQGAPIVPIGEKLLLDGYRYYINIGGIANISFNTTNYQAFDICAANRVLNMLANEAGKPYDEGGELARQGNIITPLLQELEQLEYYKKEPPKSLANDFGTSTVFSIIKKYDGIVPDLLRTYTEHIALQVKAALQFDYEKENGDTKMLVTGGGAFNTFLIERLRDILPMELIVPDDNLVQYKEALIMAFIGVLRWREEDNVLHSVTGATRDSVGGALWKG